MTQPTHPFLRLLKGVWPYRMTVVLSLLCVLGVSVSYTGGVALLYPVMKIFLSPEGIHGWADQRAVKQRLGLMILDLGSSAQRNSLSLTILATSAATPAPLRFLPAGAAISRVRILNARGTEAESHTWLGMMSLLAKAPAGARAWLRVAEDSHSPIKTIRIVLGPSDWSSRLLEGAVHWLPQDRFGSLVWIMGAFILLVIVGSIFRYFQGLLSGIVTAKVIINVRRKLFDHLIDLPISWTSSHGTHDLASRITIDTNTLADGVGTILGKVVLEPAKAATVIGLALLINWKLFLGTLIVMLPLVILIRKLGKHLRRASRRQLQGWSQVVAVSNEALSNLPVVKAYSARGYERRRFTRANRELFGSLRRLIHYLALSRPLLETLAIILVSIPVIIAADLVLKGSIGRESFFQMLVCLAAILEPLRKLNDVNNRIQTSTAAAVRCFEIIDLPGEKSFRRDLPALPRHRQSVEFQHVDFRYPNREQWVLRDITLKITRGQLIAIVGANGAGKSTLLSLLPRFYDPTRGRILIDGVDITGVSLASLRRQIGLVTQDTLLFSDTVYNNITYGYRQVSLRQVLEAARRSFADEFIQALPQGYDTPVGQGGTFLSGGQKQRIAIARAILRDPAILLLDEALSQADAESEAKISLALQDFMRDRTSFVIAHHFRTVIQASLIVCLEGGCIVGRGRHDELLAECPAYRRLYETQLLGRPESAGTPAAARP